ncbi:MAG: ATPase V [Anaerococcus sp.]|uniref:ATPase V n=1 Tax=Anaerococcus sp. TaxID=1872515 RepID=UPI0026226390|nr:ATPase V [Anaerococcus sp.]MCI5971790.1 ATPase V [Anaerococcus sp.]
MADDILLKVKEAEDKADQTIDNAKVTAREIIDQAKIKADDEYKQTITKAKEKAKMILEDAEKAANKDKEPTIEDAKADSEKLKNQSKDTIDGIVKSLSERIIENGNS